MNTSDHVADLAGIAAYNGEPFTTEDARAAVGARAAVEEVFARPVPGAASGYTRG